MLKGVGEHETVLPRPMIHFHKRKWSQKMVLKWHLDLPRKGHRLTYMVKKEEDSTPFTTTTIIMIIIIIINSL